MVGDVGPGQGGLDASAPRWGDSEEPACVAWAGSPENRTAPWSLVSPRGPRTIPTPANAGMRSILPSSPANLTPSPPQALRGIAEVAQYYSGGRRCVKGYAGILRRCFRGARTSGGRKNPWCLRIALGYLLGTASGSLSPTISARGLPRHIDRGHTPQSWTLRAGGEGGTSIPEPARGPLGDPRCGIPSKTGNRLVPNSGPYGHPTVPTRIRCAILLRVPVGPTRGVRCLQ